MGLHPLPLSIPIHLTLSEQCSQSPGGTAARGTSSGSVHYHSCPFGARELGHSGKGHSRPSAPAFLCSRTQGNQGQSGNQPVPRQVQLSRSSDICIPLVPPVHTLHLGNQGQACEEFISDLQPTSGITMVLVWSRLQVFSGDWLEWAECSSPSVPTAELL